MKRFKLLKDEQGNVALSMALLAPVLLAIVAVVTDYVVVYNKTSHLQQAADAGALAGARELGIAGNDDDDILSITRTYIFSNFDGRDSNKAEFSDLLVRPTIDIDRRGIEVELDYYWKPFLAHLFDVDILPIHITSRAGLAGESSICTLALDLKQSASISLLGKSAVIANNCTIQSNSASSSAISVPSGSKMITNSVCSSGGFTGSKNNYSTIPIVDCPVLEDPLRERKLVDRNNKCNHKNLRVSNKNKTLKPGTYCGGIFIDKNATVKLMPGVYSFIDGDLDIGGNSNLIGRGVNLNFVKNSRLFIRNSSTIELTAPKSGVMAGILIAANPSNDPTLLFEVQSKDAREFTGLVYTPNNTIKLGDDLDADGKCDPENDAPRIPRNNDDDDDEDDDDDDDKDNDQEKEDGSPKNGEEQSCESNVGQLSDWTAIIARNILVTSGVELILNADYSSSSVPVPDNDGLVSTRVRLTK